VLSSEERRIWDDVQLFWAEDAEEPPRLPPAPSRREPSSRDWAHPPLAVVVGGWITLLLLLFGAALAGLAVAVTTALGWAVWHYWPRLRGRGAPGASPRGGDAGTLHRPTDERRDTE
jgi:hypothetical protein